MARKDEVVCRPDPPWKLEESKVYRGDLINRDCARLQIGPAQGWCAVCDDRISAPRSPIAGRIDPLRSPMSRVALFSTFFLQYSQTFIHEELRQHRRYTIEVFARRRMLRERFPFEPVHVAGPLYGKTRRSRLFDRMFRERDYDLVHAHFGTGGVYGMRWARRFDLPLVVTFHGGDVAFLLSWSERLRLTNLRYTLLSKELFRTLTLGLCASTELMELLKGLGVPEHKLRVHRLGIDLDSFRKGERSPARPRVLMIGRFVEKKGFAYGLRAFAEVAAAHPSSELTIVGEGELGGALRSLARELGISNQVVFAGQLGPTEIANLLSASDVLLAPSVVDSRGNRESGLIVAKEASASQVVPIGSRHGGIPDIIDDGVTGYLVDERDVSGLAARLSALLDDPKLRDRLGRAARAKMEREYDNRERVMRLEEHYDDAIRLHEAR